MNRNKLKAMPLALALTLTCGAAFADDVADLTQAPRNSPDSDTTGFHGYLRDGAGSSSVHGPQACFGLGGNTMKYRLGNECDAYFEGGETWNFAKPDADGVVFTGTLWANEYSGNSQFGSGGSSLGLAKAYVEAKGLDFLGGGVAWVGERYYYRPDIHMLDLQFINMNGTGGGIDNIKAGPGTFSYAVFKDNDNAKQYVPSTDSYITTTAAVRQNFIYKGLPVNPGGSLDVALSLITAEGTGDHDGYNLTLLHNQDAFGGGNTFGVQYGVGPGAGTGSSTVLCCDRIGGSGTTNADSGVKRLRVFDHLWIQPTKQFSAEMIALYQRDTGDASSPVAFGGVATATGTSNWTSLGIRPAYAFSEHVKLQAELGTDSVTSPTGGQSERLTKVTIAPTLTMGSGYWARPELRLYITHANWNNAAVAAVNAANTTPGVFGNATSGTSAGLQLEAWW
jgi:maltoporin